MVQSFYIKDGLYTMKDVIKSTLHIFCRHNMRTWGIRWCKELHCIHIVRVEHWARERIGSDSSWSFEWVLYVLRCIFFVVHHPIWLVVSIFGRPERAGQQRFFGAQWPEHLVWCLLTAQLLVASDSCRHAAENTFLVGEAFRFIKLHYSHTNLELPVVTFCLWQGNYIPKCRGTVKMTVQSRTKSGHTTYCN